MAENPKQPVIVNPSPKIRFQRSADHVAKHHALIQSQDFQRAADVALLQYQTELSMQAVDGQGAAASHFKILGAQEFLQTFRLLGEVFVRPKMVDVDNLTQ